jgi:hypothetical protein
MTRKNNERAREARLNPQSTKINNSKLKRNSKTLFLIPATIAVVSIHYQNYSSNHNGLVDQITSITFSIFFQFTRKLYAAHHLESNHQIYLLVQANSFNQPCSIAKP